jgi:hypothetical protein
MCQSARLDPAKAEDISTEISIKQLLEIADRQNFDAKAGLDTKAQKGINRPFDEKHCANICKVFNDHIGRGYPIENGSIVLASTDGQLSTKVLNKEAGLIEITLEGSIPAIDRQHTTEAFRMGLKHPNEYPSLAKYIDDEKNTVSVRIVSCDVQDALRRCNVLNTGQKKWTPVETLLAMIIDAKTNEEKGIKSHEKERPSLVMFQFCHNIAKKKGHPLFDLLPVDPGVKNEAMKNRTNLPRFIDALWPLYPLLEKHRDGFKELTIEGQAEVVEKLTLPYWEKLRECLPDAFGEESWYNFNTIRKGAPSMAEMFNCFVRLWIEYRGKKSTIQLLASIKNVSLEDFVENNIPEAIQNTDPSLPWKNQQFWSLQNGAFNRVFNEEGEDGTCRYIWNTMRPSNFQGGYDEWAAYVRTIQGHSCKLRYNERKASQSAEEVKIRRQKKRQKKAS